MARTPKAKKPIAVKKKRLAPNSTRKYAPISPIDVTPEFIEEVKLLSGRGLTQQMIHAYYGVNSDFWYRLIKAHPELKAAIKMGRAFRISVVAGKLGDLVDKENLGAIIFYLKTKGRFSENPMNIEDEEQDGSSIKAYLNLQEKDPLQAAKIYQQIMIGKDEDK